MNAGKRIEAILEKISYKEFLKQRLSIYGVDSIEDLGDEQKKKFFIEVDAEWKSKNEDLN